MLDCACLAGEAKLGAGDECEQRRSVNPAESSMNPAENARNPEDSTMDPTENPQNRLENVPVEVDIPTHGEELQHISNCPELYST